MSRYVSSLIILLMLIVFPSASQRNIPRIPPVNDNYASATALTLPFTGQELNIFSATVEGSDPDVSCASALFNTVWYKVTLGADSSVIFDTTASDYDTAVAVYTGEPGTFTEIACIDNGNQPALTSFTGVSGITYSVMIGSTFPLGGGETLHLSASAVIAPINDDRDNATLITGALLEETVSLGAATIEPLDHLWVCNNTPLNYSVWYKINPIAYTWVTVEATSSGDIPRMNSLSTRSGEWVGSSICAFSVIQTFLAEPGRDTYIQVGTVGTSASLDITITTSEAVIRDFAVTSTADTRDATVGDGICADFGAACTLRAAIREANAHANDITRISLPAGTYTLNLPGVNEDDAFSGDLDLNTPIFLEGAGQGVSIIDGNDLDRVLDMRGPYSQVRDVTVRNGFLDATNGSIIYDGAGIRCSQHAILDSIELSQNSMMGFQSGYGTGAYLTNACVMVNSDVHDNLRLSSTGTWGGGISVENTYVIDTEIHHNNGSLFGIGLSAVKSVLTGLNVHHNTLYDVAHYAGGGGYLINSLLTNSAVYANYNGYGGGLILHGSNTLENVTISGNIVNFEASAIFIPTNSTGINNFRHVTIAYNTALSGSGKSIYIEDFGSEIRKVHLLNSILAGNGEINDCTLDDDVVSLGHNILECSGSNNGTDISADDPMLGALMNNGGTTLTHLPLPGSPATDAGADGADCLPVDQRGVTRPKGLGCDIGAVEFDLGANIYATPAVITLEEGMGGSYQLGLIVAPIANVDVTVTAPSGLEVSTDQLTWSGQLVRTFTTENWATLKTVFVRSVDDVSVNGSRLLLLAHSLTSADVDYNARAFDFNVNVTDDDSPGLALSSSAIAVTEGLTQTYTLALLSQPTEDVTVTVNADETSQTEVSSDGSIFDTSADFIFTSANWDVPQTVTVRAIDDILVEGNHSVNLEHNATSLDLDYDGKIAFMTVFITDSDTTSSLDLIAPTFNAALEELQPTFTWSRYLTSDSYRLRVRDSFNAVIFNQVFETGTVCTGLTCSVSFVTQAVFLTDNEFYNWEVQAIDGDDTHNSAVSPFYIGLPKPAVFDLITPSPSEIVTTLTPAFSWNVALSATAYQLRVMDAANVRVVNKKFTAGSTPSISTICDDTVCSVSLADINLSLDNKEDYEWQVIATNPTGKTLSPKRDFSVGLLKPVAFGLLAPDDVGVVDTRTPTLSWEVSDLATSYQLRVLDAADTRIVNKKFTLLSTPSVGDICDATVCTINLTQLGIKLDNHDDYEWLVIAQNSGGKTQAPKRTFEVLVPSPGVFDLLSPSDNGAVDSLTPTLQWSQPLGTLNYQIRIKDDTGVVVFKANLNAASVECASEVCSLNTSAMTYLKALKNGHEYEWFVTALNDGGKRVSSKWLFIVALARSGSESTLTLPDGFRVP